MERKGFVILTLSILASCCTSQEFLNGPSGFFSSPKFPHNFPQNSRYTWNITVSSGYIIKVTFHHFTLGWWPSKAHVTITNVASDDGRQPFQLYGSSLPDPVYSVGNSIQVIFTSLTDQYPGFMASYKAITYESVCPNLTTLSETSGVITSPFYPRYYQDNQKCSWQITASKGKRIVLDIEYMHIEYCEACSCDYLEIVSGLSSDGATFGRKCGYMRSFSYFSFRESLNVLFVSNVQSRYRGFRATYTQVNHTGLYTSEEHVSKSSGFFSSPKFPNYFPRYSRCIWNITVPSGYIIKVTFHHFDLGGRLSKACVTITDVASDDGRQPFQLDGSSLPDPVYSVENSIQVMFTSLTHQYPGFNASYMAITYESVLLTVEDVVSDKLSNSEKWSQLELVAYKNRLS